MESQKLKMLFLAVIVSGCLATPGAPKIERDPKIFKYHKYVEEHCRLTKPTDYVMSGNNWHEIDEIDRQLECTDPYYNENVVIPLYDVGVITRKIIKDEALCRRWKPDNLSKKKVIQYAKEVIRSL